MLLLLVHVLVVGAFVAGRALHARLGPVVVTPNPARELALSSGHALTLPTGRTLEEYVQAGLTDLRIMLVQAARRRHD